MSTEPFLPGDTDQADNHATAALVEELAQANARSNQTLIGLMAKVQEDADLREKKVDLLDAGLQQTRRLMVMASICLALLVGLAIANFISINQTRHAAATSREQQKVLLDEIKKYELTALYCVRINPQVADPKGEAFIDCLKQLYPSGPALNKRIGE